MTALCFTENGGVERKQQIVSIVSRYYTRRQIVASRIILVHK